MPHTDSHVVRAPTGELYDKYLTISFSETSKGWVSFKTIYPEVGFSLNNEYYTANGGILWRHHDGSVDRNSFYSNDGGINSESTVTVLFNDFPSIIKSFTTLNYEGSQSRIVENLIDNNYYNDFTKNGWFVDLVTTDQQTGTVAEFINKEGKWFNYIIGEETTWINGVPVVGGSTAPISGADGNLDTQEFSTQGIGTINSVPTVVW